VERGRSRGLDLSVVRGELRRVGDAVHRLRRVVRRLHRCILRLVRGLILLLVGLRRGGRGSTSVGVGRLWYVRVLHMALYSVYATASVQSSLKDRNYSQVLGTGAVAVACNSFTAWTGVTGSTGFSLLLGPSYSLPLDSL
jgi:hypothetical protein